MQTVKLGTICDIQAGGTPSRAEPVYWKNGTIPWVKISDFDGGNVRTTEESITQEGLDNSSAKLFPKGTILYTIFATLGEVAVLQMEAATNQAIAGLHLHDERIDAAYLYYFLISIKEKVLRLGRGVTQNNINLKILRNIDVPVPPLAEQQRIVRELQQVGALLANRRQVDEKLAELPKARFVEMFGDPVVNPMGWEKHRLDELGTCKNGMNFHNGDSGVELHCLGVGDFKNHSVITDCQILPKVSLNQIPSQDYLLKDDDIVFVRSNGNKDLVGRCLAVYPKNTPTTFSGFCIRFRADERSPITTEYLLSVLKTSGIRSMMAGRGANIQNLNQKMLSALPIPLPPLDLQRRFAAFARACAAQRAACARQIAVLETLRGKLLQDAFGAAG